jgi:hypothetical protein
MAKEKKEKEKKGKEKGYNQIAVPRAALHPHQVELFQVATSVPGWMLDEINATCEKLGRSRSYVLREALAQYFGVNR